MLREKTGKLAGGGERNSTRCGLSAVLCYRRPADVAIGGSEAPVARSP